MKYTELKESHRTELNAFPMAFAFNNSQLEEGLKKLNATKEEVLSIGNGGIIRKTDKVDFLALFTRHNKAMESAMLDNAFLEDAIIYELGNHEYCITYDQTDTVEKLDLDMQDSRVVECFKNARNEYLKTCNF